MIASIAEGHLDLADFLFLLAFILSCIAFVIRVIARPVLLDVVAMTAAMGCIALAFFVL